MTESVPLLDITSIFLVVTALLAYLNQRFFGLPVAIGVMVIALGCSLVLVGLDAIGIFEQAHDSVQALVSSLDFSGLVMQGMLSLLLFAGALHVDLKALKKYRWQIGLLAVVATMTSTLAIGYGLWWVSPLVGLNVSFVSCLLFGALISPTDPIAVMGILKSAGAPKELELVITGESLFNDGIAVVVFAILIDVMAGGRVPTLEEGALMFLHEAGGGLLYGFVLGWMTFGLLRTIDQYHVEVLIMLAMVMGGYALANHLHVSGPLAMVVAGLVLGNDGRARAMSNTTRHHVDLFWELIDQILNAVLFALIGLELLIIKFAPGVFLAAAGAVLVTLLARTLTVGLPTGVFRRPSGLPEGSWKVLTWGALRGGISVALVLSLPNGRDREVLLALTYCVVVFSILVQGLTIGRVVRHAVGSSTGDDSPSDVR